MTKMLYSPSLPNQYIYGIPTIQFIIKFIYFHLIELYKLFLQKSIMDAY